MLPVLFVAAGQRFCILKLRVYIRVLTSLISSRNNSCSLVHREIEIAVFAAENLNVIYYAICLTPLDSFASAVNSFTSSHIMTEYRNFSLEYLEADTVESDSTPLDSICVAHRHKDSLRHGKISKQTALHETEAALPTFAKPGATEFLTHKLPSFLGSLGGLKGLSGSKWSGRGSCKQDLHICDASRDNTEASQQHSTIGDIQFERSLGGVRQAVGDSEVSCNLSETSGMDVDSGQQYMNASNDSVAVARKKLREAVELNKARTRRPLGLQPDSRPSSFQCKDNSGASVEEH